MQLASRAYEAADIGAVQELYHSNGWTDGLPIVPPTEEAVRACLDWAMMPPDQLVGVEPVRGLAVTAEKLAINAVMAGCLPMHFPVVLTAWTAMMQEPFLAHGATASTGGCAVLVVLNGPVRLEIGASSSFNALGNSDRATAVIGRAIRLCLINLMDVRPGAIDRSTLGHPGKFSYCIAEDEEDTTWLPLHSQRGVERAASAVTVMAAGAPRQIMNEWTTKPEEILETFAAEMRANIHLGLEASEAIAAYKTPIEEGPGQGMSWRMAALATCFVILLSIGYWLNASKKSEQLAAMRGPDPIVVEASERSVGMSDGNKGMELQGPKTNLRAAVVTVSTEGSAGARYVDEETGQITVNNVYVE